MWLGVISWPLKASYKVCQLMFLVLFLLCGTKTLGIITQPSKYRVIVYFAMSWVTELFHPSINMTIDWHYTLGLVSRFPVKKHTGAYYHARRRCAYGSFMKRRRYVTMVKMRHGLATLNSNYSVVYDQNHKVWVLVFLVRTSGTFWDQNRADLLKFFVLQQNCIVYSNSFQGTLFSSNGLGNKTVIPCLFVV